MIRYNIKLLNNEYYKDKYPEVDCEISALYVKPDYRRKGIGQYQGLFSF